MTIGLIDVDGHNFPNLALMNIARYYKNQGDTVEWYNPFDHFDKVYMSKVFTHTPDYGYFIHSEVEKGGTGYSLDKNLPPEIDLLQPDYLIYPNLDQSTAYGFLTRGCPNKCKWCIVPTKEGNVRPYMDVDEVVIDKIQAAGISNSQQYKLAGNSIVVACLEKIFEQMFFPQYTNTRTLFG